LDSTEVVEEEVLTAFNHHRVEPEHPIVRVDFAPGPHTRGATLVMVPTGVPPGNDGFGRAAVIAAL